MVRKRQACSMGEGTAPSVGNHQRQIHCCVPPVFGTVLPFLYASVADRVYRSPQMTFSMFLPSCNRGPIRYCSRRLMAWLITSWFFMVTIQLAASWCPCMRDGTWRGDSENNCNLWLARLLLRSGRSLLVVS